MQSATPRTITGTNNPCEKFVTFTLPPSYLWYLDQDSLRTIASKFLVKMAIASDVLALLRLER